MTGGLVLGEALNLWIPAEQMIFGLAVWLLFLVCVFARRKSRYGLPVFLFVAGMSVGCLRMGAEQAVFSRVCKSLLFSFLLIAIFTVSSKNDQISYLR